MVGLNIFVALIIIFLFIFIVKSKSEPFKSKVIEDAKKISRQDTDDSRKKCYNMTRVEYENDQIAKKVDTCTRYSNDDIYIDRLCQDKLWKDAGCTKPNPINYLDEQLTKKITLLTKFKSFFNSPWDTPNKSACSGRACDSIKDTDVKVHPDCLAQLWKDVKCTTPIPQMYKQGTMEFPQSQSKTFATLKADVNGYATKDTESDRKLCYNMSREEYNKKFNIDPCVNVKDTDTNVDDLCLMKIWNDKCVGPNHYLSTPEANASAKKLTFLQLKDDINVWNTADTVTHRAGCHKMTQAEYNTANKITDPCISFPKDTDAITSQLCYEKLWKDAGCTTNSPYDLNTKW